MVIGSGPIVIGQAAEFDYSGSQACRSLREEGLRVVLVNSNPATIQTDPETADAVYVEPLTVPFLERIIAEERPQGILSGMGGQTGLNLSSELADAGILARYGVELLGTNLAAIQAGEDRERFAVLMRSIGEPVPRSRAVSSVEAAKAFAAEIGLPVIVRAAYTLGGSGSGVAHSLEELEGIAALGIAYSRIKQILIEESVLGWKEFEYEVMRDAADNCITICNMENLDPMGVHTGESIVVAPAQTLSDADHQTLRSAALRTPTDRRLFAIAEALRRGWSVDKVAELTAWDPFFLRKISRIVDLEGRLRDGTPPDGLVAEAKAAGFADAGIARLAGLPEEEVRRRRPEVAYKMVDTCGGEFEARTPYFYSTYESVTETPRLAGRKVLIVGGGPIRIGQGVEFDYCCVQGIFALREEGVAAIIANNNPETVSTDFDISDRLYFEPLLLEDVLNILEAEQPDGVILQFGGQTSVNLAVPLARELARRKSRTAILGTPAESIDLAEDRRKFASLMERIGVPQPASASGFSFDEVRAAAARIGYPVLVRPSYVLGGRGMEIVHSEEELREFMETATRVTRDHPVLVDRYLAHATEIDVDVVADGEDVLIGGIQEHIEEAGIHSGDAACVLPSQTLAEDTLAQIRSVTERICRALKVVGLANLQLAVKDDTVYVLEANPRASRTVPYVSKALGLSLAKVATKVMLGARLRDLGLLDEPHPDHVAVKAPVFPFQRLPGVDAILGPEMKSTGEVMGIGPSLGRAYYKAMVAAGNPLPTEGAVYLTVRDEDKPAILPVAQRLARLGLRIYATRGTAQFLREKGVDATTVYRISENQSPDALGLMRRGEIRLVINTPTNSSGARRDGYMMRRLAVDLNIPFLTTIQAATAAALAIEEERLGGLGVRSLRAYGASLRTEGTKL